MADGAPDLTPEEIKGALAQLDQALHHHDLWVESIYCCLICRIQPDERDLAADAHRRCRFGQWYYGPGSERLSANPCFHALENEHRKVHEVATLLLRLSGESRTVSVADYERLTSALKQMRLEILTLAREFEETLFNTDPLTGARSRIGMLTKLREQQVLVRRKIGPCSVAMMDLDLFKDVNDSYGHVVGDQVLAAIAAFVRANIRPYDSIFRYGGEEFLICVPNTTLDTSRKLFERIREGLAGLRHKAHGHEDFQTTVSIGLTLLDPDVPVEQSIERADKALYRAKSEGRNRVSVWDVSEK
ncbi:diguanylate cyclase (GGDEF) domain-containing protein [Tistlia consotensis]|uniref:diguanylate cyclase n=1 Tax=Tistlia consotensis USBA 355 TaxID=560819 RepID=A0A1Y6B7L6_9PROT|nr:diguanylate cyclase [Tistlia consotensis]SME88562.1 diguanylate cyclase (GGDEF) domain-containing protein [Tistlia consotensis USBA 355]SNR25055.1 diguanylate cyclase (GGDEF) domain-containing protein [Tistlia consotensis]